MSNDANRKTIETMWAALSDMDWETLEVLPHRRRPLRRRPHRRSGCARARARDDAPAHRLRPSHRSSAHDPSPGRRGRHGLPRPHRGLDLQDRREGVEPVRHAPRAARTARSRAGATTGTCRASSASSRSGSSKRWRSTTRASSRIEQGLRRLSARDRHHAATRRRRTQLRSEGPQRDARPTAPDVSRQDRVLPREPGRAVEHHRGTCQQRHPDPDGRAPRRRT